MKIRINKLFDKYTSIVNLNKEISIYLGENGIGKSTTMNMLYYILTGNFADILRFPFESIDIFTNSDSINIRYSDLIFSKSRLYIGGAIYNKKRQIISLLEDGNVNYETVIREIMFSGKFTSLTMRNIKDCIDQMDIKDINQMDFKRFIKNKVVKKMTETRKRKLLCYDDTPFVENRLYEKVYRLLKKYIITPTFLISKIDDLRFINRFIDERKQIITKYNDFVELNSKDINQTIKNYKEYFNTHSIRDIVEKTDINLTSDRFYRHYKNKNEFNLNELLVNICYNKEDVYIFLDKYYEKLRYYLNNRNGFYEDYKISSNISSILKRKIELYLRPLIPYNSFYTPEIWNVFTETELENLIEMIESYKIKSADKLFEKYFLNKNIYLTPSKLIISDNYEYKNYKDDFDITYLSNGELKIIILVLLSMLNKEKIIIVDEIEEAISIVWQQSIIDNLMRKSENLKLITTTHSPYIINDKFMDNIVVLPGDNYE